MGWKQCKQDDIKYRGLRCPCCTLRLKMELDQAEIFRLNERLGDERNLRLALRHCTITNMKAPDKCRG